MTNSRVVGRRVIGGWGRAFLTVALFAPAAGLAQAPRSFINQQRQIEEEIRQHLDEKAPLTQRTEAEWGGFYNFFLFINDDGINSSRTYRRNDLRLWGRVGLHEGAHEFYARGLLTYEDYNTGDAPDGNDDDWWGPNLERGYYQFDLRNALWAYGRQRVDYNLKVKVGRDYTEWGTGYAIALPLDQVTLTGEFANFEVTGLIGKTPNSLPNIDTTRPLYDNSDRCFGGVQVRYLGFENHRPFFYWMKQNDKANESRFYHPFPDFQDFSYDSEYFGFGSEGQLIKDLRYSTEWVIENGKSYGDRMFYRQNDIHAWAFDILLEYLPKWKLTPRFLFEYMFASGDPDRFGSPTNAIGGNTKGDDKSFVGFGYRDTGLAFAPRLSNINIWRLGASFYPFEEVQALEKLELGTDWFLYAKNHSEGAVSDPLAGNASSYLGWEMDYFANWRLTSDLAVTARLGAFFPGQAFEDKTCRTFFLTGVTWSF